jgi:hypothetical protein
MSEIKGIEISDVLGLSQPLAKLIECVSFGVGKLYEPTHIKRMAKARAKEIAIISGEINEHINLPMKYERGDISIDTMEAKDLIKRTGNRLLFQEIQKQQNIESIVSDAYDELEKETKVSEEPIDKDWILRFFNSIEDISDEMMQKLWAKILSGEIKQPGSYSLRTLENLKNLSKKEAELFQKIADFVLCAGDKYFIYRDEALLEKYNIFFSELLKLEECGLVKTNEIAVEFIFQEKNTTALRNRKIIGIISINTKEKPKWIKAYLLTESGKQLYKIINNFGNTEYILDILKYLRNDKTLGVTAHIINLIGDDNINYEDDDILASQIEQRGTLI